jgi:CRISPR system Cascade subunit CasD
MRFIVIGFDGFLAFGGPAVGEVRSTDIFPACSMVTGLIANALGYESGEKERLQRLQESIVMGSRIDQPGDRIMDFQTAELGKKNMMWRSDGFGPDVRAGGEGTYSGPALRYKHYLADSVVSTVVGFRTPESDESPSVDAVAHALQYPFRVLFIGRYCCIPYSSLFRGIIEAPSVLSALNMLPFQNDTECSQGEWPVSLHQEESGEMMIERQDIRDWRNDIHAGSRLVWRGPIRR